MKRAALAAALAILPLFSCFGILSPENQKQADEFYDNAHTYYRGKDYPRSLDQIERGMRLAPDHYKLNQLKGKILLQQARANPDLYDDALELFERVRSLRGEHDYELTLDLGQTHQGLYTRHRRAWKRLTREAGETRGSEANRRTKIAQATENRRLAQEHLREAEQAYRSILDADDLGVFPATERLFLLEIQKGLDVTGTARAEQLRRAAELGKKYLDTNAFRQEWYEVMVKKTGASWQENQGRRHLRELRAREMGFRTAYARILFQLKDFATARKQLDRVLDLDPTRAPEYYNRALCLVKLDQKTLAKQDLQHFLRLTKKPFESREVKEANRLLATLGQL